LMAVLADVTTSVHRDRELRQHQVWISALATGMTDYALVSLDPRGVVRHWNSGVARITGFDESATLGRSCSMFYLADTNTPERMNDRLADADHAGWSLDEGWRIRADGSRYWGSCLIAPLHDDAPSDAERGYTLILRDISDRREANEALRQSIACDHLTGLANRRAFFEAAETELQRWRRMPRPLSLVMIDADHFKRINDSHGHAAGDAVLRHLAAALSAQCGGVDVAARLGGEEFVLLLPGRSCDSACELAERLRTVMASTPVFVDGVPICCAISAGVASMESDVGGINALLQRADAALYAAKAAGRNRVLRWQDDRDRT
jgi:diguanylate cyclase (GGDEF)-like protein/PAS domain S-box-containing protein